MLSICPANLVDSYTKALLVLELLRTVLDILCTSFKTTRDCLKLLLFNDAEATPTAPSGFIEEFRTMTW